MTYLIRLATILDASQIADVHITSWQTTYRGQIPEHILNNLSLEERSKEWKTWLTAGVNVLVIEVDNKIIGFASICPTRDSDDDPKMVAELSAIYLLPEYWRQGLGKTLCKSVFNTILENGYKSVTTWVLESNIQARDFYKSIGFTETKDTQTDHIGCESLKVIRYRKVF